MLITAAEQRSETLGLFRRQARRLINNLANVLFQGHRAQVANSRIDGGPAFGVMALQRGHACACRGAGRS
jgi:hypothetical protein